MFYHQTDPFDDNPQAYIQVIIFNESTIMETATAYQQPTSDTLASKQFDSKWYGSDNPFYYIYPTFPDGSKRTNESRELYRTITGIRLNRTSSICFIGEAHLGPTRMLDFHKK